MLIHEIAECCNVTKKAIQYYVEQGLLAPQVLENGYQDFSEQDARGLTKIVLYRKLGLSISEIKSVLKDNKEIKHILQQRTLELEREKIKQELLKRLAEGETVEHLECEINHIGSNDIIIRKLLELFPGYFGKFFSLNFSRYLTGEIKTKEQMEAFYQILAFFDNVPNISLPEDLQRFLDEYMEEYAGQNGTDRIYDILCGKEQAVQNIDEFIDKNKEILKAYKEFKQTDVYKNSPVVRLMEYMKNVCEANGYYDVFIPAMRKLSPLYNEYYEQMLQANELLLKKYPEYV